MFKTKSGTTRTARSGADRANRADATRLVSGPPRRNRFWSIVVAAVSLACVASVLAACGSSGGSSGNGNGVTKITLSMHNPNSQQQDPATYEIVQAFNAKDPKVQVVLTGQPVEQHEQQMTIAAQSNTLPEIFWVYNSLAQTMVKSNKLLDLTPILSEGGLSSKFAPNMLSGFKSGNVQYGLPYQTLVTGFYYNKAILAKYNISLPRTFDELLAATKTLKANGITTIAQGANNSSFSVWAFLTMLDRFGYEDKISGILDKSGSFSNDDFKRLYSHIQELGKAGAFPSNMTTQTYVQAVQSFMDGKAAMVDTGVWDAGKIGASPVGKDVGFWAGPTFSDGVGKQELFMNAPSAPLVASAAVKKDTAKYNAVKSFLQFYYSDAGQKLLVKNAQIPVTTYQPTAAESSSPVFAAVLAEITKPGWSSPAAQPDLVVSAETSNAIYQSLYGVMEGVVSPDKALSLVQQTLR
jgi:raffinose/stachyose/melibiose transport system substrate-binding protein